MNSKELEMWREVRTKGELWYVLKHSLLWAFCVGMGRLLLDLIFKRYLRDGWNYLIYNVVLYTAFFFLAGCLMNIRGWRRNEKEYSRATSLDEEHLIQPEHK